MNRHYFLNHYSLPGRMPTFIISSPARKVLLFHVPDEDAEIQSGQVLNQDHNTWKVVGLVFRPTITQLQSLRPFDDVHYSYLSFQ